MGYLSNFYLCLQYFSCHLGEYCTISNDGIVNFWDLDWDLRKSFKTFSTVGSKVLILEASYLVDLQIICLSTIRCDLRFFDISGHKYFFRMIIENFPAPIVTMDNSNKLAPRLLCGDLQGNVIILEFQKMFKRVFRSGISVRELVYSELLKKEYDYVKAIEYPRLHGNTVSQVQIDDTMNSFISSSEQSEYSKEYVPSVVIGSMGFAGLEVTDQLTKFYITGGVTCFAYDEECQILATGGADFMLRLWHPMIPQKPKFIFTGHCSKIILIFIQDNGDKIYSIDESKTIKIWDYLEETLLQTHIELKSSLPLPVPMVFYYNDYTRELLIGTKKLTILKCSSRLNLEFTDGDTHVKSVSAVLYNKLFDVIVTCGYDSYIIVWEFYTGKRCTLIKNAHTIDIHGDTIVYEITAACFDPNHQLLLTGARDGSLKVWNFNEGFCLRKLAIEEMCEVTAVFWLTGRILAVGWNRHVTEFSDVREFKPNVEDISWKTCHTDEILCAAVHSPHSLVTSSTKGDFLFWNLQTGHPYLKFNMANPNKKVRIEFIDPKSTGNLGKMRRSTIFGMRRSTMFGWRKSMMRDGSTISDNTQFARQRLSRLGVLRLPEEITDMKKKLAIESMISLDTRPNEPNVGSLFVSLNNGWIQVWSAHVKTETFLGKFNAVHAVGDTVTTMATDIQNKYLFTGTSHGYIKTWFVKDYCYLKMSRKETIIERLRQTSMFPFLWKDSLDYQSRAKRGVKLQEFPWLLNSYRGHKSPISDLTFVEGSQLLISSSGDKSVRLWTLPGRYIGTLGSPILWKTLKPHEVTPLDYSYRIPNDLKREMSFTTRKVLKGRADERKPMEQDGGQVKERTESAGSQGLNEEQQKIPFCKQAIDTPSIARNLPKREYKAFEKPVLDTSLPFIPIYKHLMIHSTSRVPFPASVPKCYQNTEEFAGWPAESEDKS
jgi:WD40 repeat protein